MIFIAALLNLLLGLRKYKSSQTYYASHHDFTPISITTLNFEKKDFNNQTNNYYKIALLLRYHYNLNPNTNLDEIPPYNYKEMNATDITTIQKSFRYYQLLQILQSPYVSQQQKIETIQQNKEIFPISSLTTRPNIWNGLDW